MADSPAFRLFVLAFVLLMIAVPLMIFRIWRVSPGGEGRVVRISTLDYLQAWSLKRKAQAAVERQDYPNALLAWRAAAANNPSDGEALRGGLQAIQRIAAAPEQASSALTMGAWLLRVGETNAADLELIGGVWNRCELYDRSALLLSGVTNVTSPGLDRLRAVSYFRSGRVNEFQRLLKSNPAIKSAIEGAITASNPEEASTWEDLEFNTVAVAYLAGWGPAEDRSAALKILESLADAPRTEQLASELLMTVYIQTRDIPGCEAVFRRLQGRGKTGIWHLTGYCSLLAIEGNKDRARQLLKEANPVPRTDSEVMRLIALQMLLGLHEEADALCQHYFSEPPWVDQGALLRTELLSQLKRWDDLRNLAYRIRKYPSVMENLGGFAYYIEGLAEYFQGYRANADAAFKRACEVGFEDPRLAVRVADGLLKLGGPRYADLAERLLLKERVKSSFGSDVSYLTLLVTCADALKNGDYLWDTVTNLYALAPQNANVMNNYAATLLLFRRNPEEALVHTLRLIKAYPNSPEAILNHAVALTMNGRTDEAETLLDRILPDRLSSEDLRTQYYIALFELRLLQHRMPEARQALRLIDTSRLFPVQVQWLETNATMLDEQAVPAPGTGG